MTKGFPPFSDFLPATFLQPKRFVKIIEYEGLVSSFQYSAFSVNADGSQ
jgi:hypothetical protein